MKSSNILKFSIAKGLYTYNIGEKSEQITDIPDYVKEFTYMGYCLYYLENAKKAPDTLEFETTDIKRWTKVLPQIRELFFFLTGKLIDIYPLSSKKSNTSEAAFKYVKGDYALALFSGGADSFAGAFELFKNHKKVILSHTTTAPFMQSIAKELFDASFDKSKTNLYITNYAFPKELMNYSYPQLRSTLFLMNTAPIVEKFQLSEINIPENGYMMLNPPVSLIARSTKSTRPEILLLLQSIFTSYFGREIKITSPFTNKTKTDVLRSVHKNKGFDITSSCFNYRWGRFHGRCGKCFGCNITRLSLYSLGSKPIKKYYYSPFDLKQIPLNEEDRKNLFLYSDFIDLIKNYVFNYAGLSDNMKDSISSAEIAYKKMGLKVDIKELLERFGLDMLRGLKNYYLLNKIEPEDTLLGKKYVLIVKENKLGI